MFGANRKRKARAGEASVPEIAPPPDQEPPTNPVYAVLLQRWMSLADMQRRVIQALAGEITQTSTFVETEADSLSSRFRGLAVGARRQTARVDGLTALATGIAVAGATVSIDEVASLLEATLNDVVAKILSLSKTSMAMVYALDLVDSSVKRVEGCLDQADGINRVTKMLALNARIEAERAGPAGRAFTVVANEVSELSRDMKELSTTMSRELKAVVAGITTAHATLKQVATMDMSESILVKERLDQILPALVSRNGELKTIVAEALAEAETMSADAGAMVTGIQFQDRTKQRLEHVIDTMHVLDQAIADVTRGTMEGAPEIARAMTPDTEWVKELVSRFTMSEMRERFVAQLLGGGVDDTPHEAAVSDSGSIELF